MPTFEPIGCVRTSAKETIDEGWGDVESLIELAPEFLDGLIGLDGFSHAIVLTHLHLARYEATSHLVRHPRDRNDLPRCGIFSQRAKHRPNPIGVTTVRILGVQERGLLVKGLDAIDGTPVLDIKPYVPAMDAADSASIPDWMVAIMSGYF